MVGIGPDMNPPTGEEVDAMVHVFSYLKKVFNEVNFVFVGLGVLLFWSYKIGKFHKDLITWKDYVDSKIKEQTQFITWEEFKDQQTICSSELSAAFGEDISYNRESLCLIMGHLKITPPSREGRHRRKEDRKDGIG